MAGVSFRSVMETAIREAVNDNQGPVEIAETVITDLRVAGFCIRRSFDPVDYDRPVTVLYQPERGSAASFPGQTHLMAASVDDLGGEKGFLVIWTENGRARAGWFDREGRSIKQPDYRVVNPKTPCAGAMAARAAIPQVA